VAGHFYDEQLLVEVFFWGVFFSFRGGFFSLGGVSFFFQLELLRRSRGKRFLSGNVLLPPEGKILSSIGARASSSDSRRSFVLRIDKPLFPR